MVCRECIIGILMASYISAAHADHFKDATEAAYCVVTVCRSEACEVRYRFDVPYESVGHVRRLAYIAAYENFLCC
jgi:hypothetical protein